MPVTAQSAPNIALIKYWGNRNDELRLPAADSLSMTLDSPHVEITADHADTLSVRSLKADGTEWELTEQHLNRFWKHLNLTERYLATLGKADALPASVSMIIRSAIPRGIGLASSAAIFACAARAYADLVRDAILLTDEQVSVIARLGSGSAARSICGGFVALEAGAGDAIDAAKARHIAPASHWRLHDIVIIPSHDEKEIGSTEGHKLAPTSPLFAARLDAIRSYRQRECIDAIVKRDFEKLQRVAEEDSFDMHAVMQTSTPALHYLTEDTHRIVRDVSKLRDRERIPVLYTTDAGPTVHLFCLDEATDAVREFAHAQKGCTIFETKTGGGARVIEERLMVHQ